MDRRSRDSEGSTWGIVATVGVVAAAVACCALPALLATVGIGVIGGMIGHFAGLGWPLALVAAVILGAGVYWWVRRRQPRDSLMPGRGTRR